MKRVLALLALAFAALVLNLEPVQREPLVPQASSSSGARDNDLSRLEDAPLRGQVATAGGRGVQHPTPPAAVTGSVRVALLDDRTEVALALEPMGPGRLRWATTDSAGGAHFEDVPPGMYRVGTQGDGRVLPRQVEVVPGQSTRVTLHARQVDRSLHGRLVDGDGRPLPGHLVRIERLRSRAETRLMGMGSTCTNETGSFVFEELPPDSILLSASPTTVRRTGLGRVRPGPMVVLCEDIDLGQSTRLDLGEVELPGFEGYVLAATLPTGTRGEVRLPGARRGVPLQADARGQVTWASLHPPPDLELWLFDQTGTTAMHRLRPVSGRRELVRLAAR